MSSASPLGDAMLYLLDHPQQDTSDRAKRLLGNASAAADFLTRTGQLYPFLDFHSHTSADRIQSISFSEIIIFLKQLWTDEHSASEKEMLRVAISALAYIEATGQESEFEDYLVYWDDDGIPPVIAFFQSQDEAEAWLMSLTVPPYLANILVANRYYHVQMSLEIRMPVVTPAYYVAEYIERSVKDGLPPPLAAFDTLEQAETWLATTPEPPRHAFITVGGEYHLAACWKNVNHRAIYPFTVVDDMRREISEALERLGVGERTRLERERRGGEHGPEEEDRDEGRPEEDSE